MYRGADGFILFTIFTLSYYNLQTILSIVASSIATLLNFYSRGFKVVWVQSAAKIKMAKILMTLFNEIVLYQRKAMNLHNHTIISKFVPHFLLGFFFLSIRTNSCYNRSKKSRFLKVTLHIFWVTLILQICESDIVRVGLGWTCSRKVILVLYWATSIISGENMFFN